MAKGCDSFAHELYNGESPAVKAWMIGRAKMKPPLDTACLVHSEVWIARAGTSPVLHPDYSSTWIHRSAGGSNQLSLVSCASKADAEATHIGSALEAICDCLGQSGANDRSG